MVLPKVSILIPCYNQENFIRETVLSALNQSYENIEVVVCDDASNDNTPQILKELEEQYQPKLKVYCHQENLGITKNHTRGLLKCSGELIAFLDGDDLFLADKIEKQVHFMLERPECTLSYHDVDVFDSVSGKTLYLWSKRISTREGKINDLIRFGNFLPAVGVMVWKKDIPETGYDERVKVYSDWLLWLSTLYQGKGKICYLGETLAKYRRHEANLTNSSTWKTIDQNTVLDIVSSGWPEFRFEVRMRRSELYFIQALNALIKRQFGSGLKTLLQALTLGFPFFPWMRLLLREIGFLVRNNFRLDYIFKSNISE